MEIFNELVIPVGSGHFELMRFLLWTATLLLYSYIGLLFGSVVLSVIFSKRSRDNNNFNYLDMAQDYIATGTGIPSMWFGLGIIPFISIILTYIQLLHGSGSDVVGYLFIGFFLFIGGIAAAYTYKNAVNLNTVFTLFKQNVKSKSKNIVAQNDDISLENESLGQASGTWAIVLLLLAAWFISGGTTYAFTPELWGASIFDMLFHGNTIFKLSVILTLGLAFAPAVYLFNNFYWDGGKEFNDDEYKEFAKSESRRAALISSLFLPLLYAFEVITVPQNALSGLFFVFALLSLLFTIFFAQSVYLLKDKKHTTAIRFGFMFVMLSFVFFTASDQQALRISTYENVAEIIEIHNQQEEKRLALYESEEAQPKVDADAIYQNRCSACHQFDQKLVGPAYNNVVPKYADKKDELYKFIYDPYPVNPDEYPGGMANQGLTLQEAKAMADYLLEKVVGGEEENKEGEDSAPTEEENTETTKEEATTASN